MTVMLTGARASFWAAFRPPKPAPTITTRCAVWLSIPLPSTLLLYKIQRDGNRLQKFGCGLASGVGAVACSISERRILRGAAGSARVYPAIAAVVGRCRDRLAHPDRATDSGDA